MSEIPIETLEKIAAQFNERRQSMLESLDDDALRTMLTELGPVMAFQSLRQAMFMTIPGETTPECEDCQLRDYARWKAYGWICAALVEYAKR